MTKTESTKTAVRRFWTNRPCGIVHSSEPANTSTFFRETEEHRFKIHTDWNKQFLRDAAGFANHTGKLVLEIGCGIGVDAMEWHRSGNRVVALDYNFPSVTITRDRFDQEGAGGAFLNGDGEALPFANESFDLVYSFGVLHHTPGTEKAVDEVYRCLKKDGQAIIMLYHKWSAMVIGEVFLGYGLRQGALWKTHSIGDLISNYTEWDSQTAESINPLTRVFSRRQAKKMFRKFSSVEMETHYLWPGHFGPLRRLLPLVPKKLKKDLPQRFGWNLIIKASK